MKTEKLMINKIIKDVFISALLYATPVVLMLITFSITGAKPWETYVHKDVTSDNFPAQVFQHLNTWGLPFIMLIIGVVEFAYGLYEKRWTKNERMLDIVCFVIPKVIVGPSIAYLGLLVLPQVLPNAKGMFEWVPFWWGFFIIAIGDDLTQYWYHRLHHQLPWLWRFHRTHHSAPYMGMAMSSRQNFWYTIFFSQIYFTTVMTYLGLGYEVLFVTGVKALIVTGAHSSIKWDKPFYKYKLLKPIGWVLERLISTPATHHAHHADTDGDGIGHYKGNFGNMFFIWDLIFGTGIITRKYPSGYGIQFYKEEEWHAQFLWPFLKSKKEGSELHKHGPMVGDAATTELKVNTITIEELKELKPA